MPAYDNISFQLPNVPYDEKLACCLAIMRKQHSELLPLRRSVVGLRLQHDKLKREIQEWKDKYQKTKEELREIKKENNKLKEEIKKLTKTNKRYQVPLFDHGNFKNPTDTDKKHKGGQLGHQDTNRESYNDYTSYPKQRLFAKTCGKCHSPLSR